VNPERWQQIKDVLNDALKREPSQRDAFLAEACADDSVLRVEVEKLLADYHTDFMEEPAIGGVKEIIASARQELRKGQILGRYRIVKQIGAGGMGEVYLAHDIELERDVALKILGADVSTNAQRMQRFIQEAKTASALNHPNIITIHEVGQAEGLRFIATEYIKGENLRQRLLREPLSLRECFDLALQVAAALSAAHEAKVVHRDIKPENIMQRPDGLVKVLDFGLAKLTEKTKETTGQDPDASTRLQIKTEPGVVMGTVNYMSPEQARGKEVDLRTDIWSFGVVLYEMWTGVMPFGGETASDVIATILKSEPAPLPADAPAELQRIIRKALRKEPDERYQTVKDLLLDLKSLQRELEFAAEIERSMSTQLKAGAVQTASVGADSAPVSEARTATAEAGRTVSSAEYLVAGIRQHKLAAIAAIVLIAAGVIALAAYLRGPNHEVAIESIAVLPFANQNHDPDSDYLSDGLTESIINSLTQLPNLKVIARSSVFRYKGKETDPFAAGKEMNVRAVLTGRIMQRGDSIVISTELLDVRENKQLWGEQYSKKISDLLSIQRDIAREITGNLRLTLSGEERNRVVKHYTDNADAYQLYLKGRFYWNKRTEESYQKAIEYFRQAIEKDPNYALAYTGLADCYSFLSGQGIRSPQDVFPLAKEAAAKAIEIDSSLSEAHTSMAYVKLYYDWDWAAAESEYQQAIALNPNSSIPHHGYAYLLISAGRTEDAIKEIKKAEDLDPLSLTIQSDHGEFYYFARRPDESIAQLQKALDMDGSFVRAHFLLARALVQKGRCDDGIAEFLKARSIDPNGIEMIGGLAQGYASCGRRAEAELTLHELIELSKQRYVSPHWMASTQAALGNKDEAFKSLDQAFDRRFGPLIYLKVNPIWDPLRSDPRFAERLRRLGLTP
jgi:eukaryotic-like serine/threonine-protein kinase